MIIIDCNLKCDRIFRDKRNFFITFLLSIALFDFKDFQNTNNSGILVRIQFSRRGDRFCLGYTTLHYLSSAIGIFTATLYHLPCTVRATICIGVRVGLMESPRSRERNYTWMGFDIVSIPRCGLPFVLWNSR